MRVGPISKIWDDFIPLGCARCIDRQCVAKFGQVPGILWGFRKEEIADLVNSNPQCNNQVFSGAGPFDLMALAVVY